VKQYLSSSPNGSQNFVSNFQAKNWRCLWRCRFFMQINLKETFCGF